MAAKQLLPGYGSKYTSETIIGSVAGTVGVDALDTSRCAQFAVQISSISRVRGTIQVEQTIDGTNWANLGSSTAIALGTILRFGATAGPYGKVRFKVTDPDAEVDILVSGSASVSASEASESSTADEGVEVVLTAVGFEMQGVA